MADWPDADEFKQVLNVDSNDWDTTLDRVRLAAIQTVKSVRGAWDELTDTPDENLAQASLRMGELISERPPGVSIKQLTQDPTFQTLMSGHRRRFGIG